MPTTPPVQTPGRTPTFDESGLEQLGDRINQQGRRRGSRRKRRTAWVLGSVAVLLLVVVGGAFGYTWYLNNEIHRIDVKGLTAAETTGDLAGTENILLVGSTDRCALKVQNAAYGLCSQGVNGVNSDVVMILHLDPNTGKVAILSIPRDLFVPNARVDGANKIDAGLYNGPSQLVASIKENLGISIQHYVVLNFDTFANVVDALGGVNMYFPEPVFDQYSGLVQRTTGCVHLDGIRALQVVRARHLQYQPPGNTNPYPENWPFENQSDIARIRRDHEFLRVLASAVGKQGLSNPVTDQQLISSVAPQLQVDNKLSIGDMVNLVLGFHAVNPQKAPQLTLPVEVDQFGSYLYKGGYYGDIEFPVNTLDLKVIDQFLNLPGNDNTLTGHALPSPAQVTVSVLNGSGTAGQAGTTSSQLQALGFHVTGVGDATPVGAEAETVVYFSHKTAADEAAAQEVARSMSGAVITAYGPTTNGAQVTVVTGTQFTVNAPARAASSTTTPAPAGASGSSGGSTTTTTSSSLFQAPTVAVSPLQPWDPRACTPSGGEGH